MDSKYCWLRSNCKQLHCDDSNGCMILYKLDFLYNEANVPLKMRQNITLRVDADGTDLEEFTKLKSIQDSIIDFVNSGTQLLIHSKGCGNGKAQPDSAKLLTPQGYITMKNINIGDSIFGDDGKIYMVLGKFDRGYKPVYRITFNDNTSVECCDEHLWNISDRVRQPKTFKTIELKELIGKNLHRHKDKGWRYQIPITKALEFEHSDTLIDPFLLGYIIGDGCTHSNSSVVLTISDIDAADALKNLLPTLPNSYEIRKAKTRPYGYTITNSDCKFGRKTKSEQYVNIIKKALKTYGIIDLKGPEKFIPKQFLYNDANVRLAILQGLMDTDGTVATGTNALSYGTTSKQLALDVQFLVQSLGGTAKISMKNLNKRYRYSDNLDHTFYYIQIKLPSNICPFRLPRKIAAYANNQQNEPYRAIHRIEYVGEKHCYCISTSNPSELYLTDNCIVTHNTSWGIRLLQTYFNKIWLKSELTCKALFINVPHFLLALKDNISTKNEYIQHIKENVLTCDLVIWDDIGTKNSTSFESENLLSMIEGRILNNKANIFTSNLNDQELHDALGDRLASRICNLGYNIVFNGGDKRGINNV